MTASDKKLVFPENAKKRLIAAASIGQTVYVYGATVFGKTTLVLDTLKDSNYTYIDCKALNWGDHIVVEQGSDVLIVDNLYLLHDEEQQEEIMAHIAHRDVFVVLISRANIPAWLLKMNMAEGFIKITEKYLSYTEDDVKRLAKLRKVAVTEEQVKQINTLCEGSAFAVNFCLRLMQQGKMPGEEMDSYVLQEVAKYFDALVISEYESTMIQFMVQLSIVDRFDVGLAKIITGNSRTAAYIDEMKMLGNFLLEENGIYSFRSPFLKALRIRANRELLDSKRHLLEYNAGLYYEMNNDILSAAYMYQSCGNREKELEILEKNVELNPGQGFYIELKDRYLSLQEEEVENRPILLAGLSMLYAIMLKPQESDGWYEKLKFLHDISKGSLRQEAEIWLLYLDIALPQKCGAKLIQIAKTIPKKIFQKNIKLPSFSVTSNMPGIMNGGLDFSDWSKHDRELAVSIGWILEKVFGKFGYGFVNTALAESQYEQGGDLYEVMSLISKAQIEAELGGCDEIYFVTVAIQARVNVLQGDLQTAISLIEAFYKKIEKRAPKRLVENVLAFRVRLALYEQDKDFLMQWMQEEAPNEKMEFFGLERYRYFTKVRGYILLGEYQNAYMLLEKLLYYTTLYKRTIMGIEVRMLMSVVKKQLGLSWKDDLVTALKMANEYSFYRIFSETGAVVLDLVQAAAKEIRGCDQISETYIEQLLAEGKKVCQYYPSHLLSETVPVPILSENGLKVLRMQADGLSRQEMADALYVSVDNIKYHIKQNYKKLNVDNKTDAIKKAQSYHLL